MKKIIVLVVFAISTIGFSQDVTFGAKIGANISSILYSEDLPNMENERLIAFHIGAMSEFKLTNVVSLQPEFVLSLQGGEFSSTVDYGSLGKTEIKSSNRYGYINLPVMGKFYVAKGLSVEVGPQLGVLVYHSYKTSVVSTMSVDSENIFKSNDPRAIDFALSGGLAYKFANGLSLGGRYNLGISKAYKDKKAGFYEKNRVVQISIGYFFN